MPDDVIALIAKWREQARIGRQYQLGDAQWVAALSSRVYSECANELEAAAQALKQPASDPAVPSRDA